MHVLLAALALMMGVVTGGAPAVPVDAPTEVVTVYNQRALDPAVAKAAINAAVQAGGFGIVADSGVIGLLAVTRGSQVVQAPPAGWRYPLSTTVVSPSLAGRVMSRAVARVLSNRAVVMGASTATLRGAAAGDVVRLAGWNGGEFQLPIGMVAPDDEVGGTELVISNDVAAAMGVVRPARVVMWGFRSRTAIDAALAGNGLVKPSIRIRRSWDPPDPDDLLSSVQVKQALGEFFYMGGLGTMRIDPTWQAANIATVAFAGVGVRSRCNRLVIPAMQGALSEVAAAGLAGAIDTVNTNSYGGCFNPNEIAALGSTTGGFVSRHTWGMALDMNTTTNVEGGTPHMDCRVVRIFRKWGFAWGGNFLNSDGMHFEWVGEPCDQLSYPSRYCPNIVTAPAAAPAAADSGRAQLFTEGYER